MLDRAQKKEGFIMTTKECFTKNLNKYMQIKNCTQLELAEILHVSNVTVHKWCKGKTIPRMDKIDLICKYFCITREQLLTDNYTEVEVVADDLVRRIRRLSAYDQKTILAMVDRFEEEKNRKEE